MSNKLKAVILIVFIFINCCALPVISKAEEPSANEAEYYEAVKLLTSLGLIPADGSYENTADSKVTRGEFAVIAARMMNESDYPFSGTLPFTDVAADYYAAGSIEAAYNRGIINGYTETTFEPEMPIVYTHAAKMMVTLLGYKREAAAGGGYPIGYTAVAQKLGLGKGIKALPDDLITRYDLVMMVKNAIEVNYPTESGFEDDIVKYEIPDDYTILSEFFDIYKESGIVEANNVTGLYSQEGMGKNYVKINNRVFLKNDIGADELLGLNVDFYYQMYDGENVLKYIVPNKKNKTEKITADNIISYKDNRLTYETETGKVKTADIKVDANIIYNGAAITERLEDSEFVPKIGNIELVSNSGGSSYNVIFINNYENYVFSAVSPAHDVIYGKYSTGRQLDLKDKTAGEDYIAKDIYGNTVPVNMISEWEVLSVKRSAGDKFIEINIITDTVEGVVSGTLDNKVIINDKEYRLSKSYTDAGLSVRAGDSGRFYLDIEGNIAAVDTDADGKDLGFLTYAYFDESNDDILYGRLLVHNTTGGELKDFRFADKVAYNGMSVDAADLYTLLLDKDGKEPGADTSKILRRIVKYELNADKEIKKLETTENTYGGLSYTLKNENRRDYYEYSTYEHCFAPGSLHLKENRGKAVLSDNCIIFNVPFENISASDVYATKTVNNFSGSGIVECYRTDNKGFSSEAAVIYRDTASGASNPKKDEPICVFDSYVKCINEDDETVYKIKLFKDGRYIELMTDSSIDIDNIQLYGTDLYASIKPGDLIRYSVNYKGEINLIEVDYRYEENKEYSVWSSGYDSIQLDPRMVYRKDDGSKLINCVNFDYTSGELDMSDEQYLYVNGYKLYVIDMGKKQNRVSVATMQDFLDYESYGGECSRIVINRQYSDPRRIFIYKREVR